MTRQRGQALPRPYVLGEDMLRDYIVFIPTYLVLGAGAIAIVKFMLWAGAVLYGL